MSDDEPTGPSPFHQGEVTLQKSVGVVERMEQFGRRAIRDYMPDQHREFFNQLPFVVLGSVDTADDTWVTLISGKPGFMTSHDPKALELTTWLDPLDPGVSALEEGGAVGLLGIEFHTRRRNRLNGIICNKGSKNFRVEVEHSFGNCPQYIQLRDYRFERDPSIADSLTASDTVELSLEDVRSLIEGADTFFVSSYVDDERGRHVDASHRGGKPGFVRINEDGLLTIPDFAGNLLFNTLGNFAVNSKAGLVFPNFENGNMLQLTGDAQLILESEEINAFQGAERLWTFRPRKIVLRRGALPLRFDTPDNFYSPNTLMTGDWDQARSRIEAKKLRTIWRPFKVTKIVEESSVIRSFHLEPADGKGIIPHQAGQHLPIRVTPKNASGPVLRTYTISTAPSDGYYRLSVRKQGSVSEHLHDALQEGDVIEVRAPAGSFTIDPFEARPAVLLAAGVGITPILAMLRHIVFEGLRTRHIRPTYVFVGSRSLSERAFADEISDLMSKSEGAVKLITVISDTGGMEPGVHFDAKGRINRALLREALPFDGYDFYMCGPPTFMQDLYDQLRDMDVPDERIHAETFGPSTLIRHTKAAIEPLAPAATDAVSVTFLKSGKEAQWNPGEGSLLELAETRGLSPDFSCRSGNCGTCSVRVISGRITYATAPVGPVAEDSALICCAIPAANYSEDNVRLVLDL
jgi:uncharacterized protein